VPLYPRLALGEEVPVGELFGELAHRVALLRNGALYGARRRV
jgi:hypothetical protein